MLPRCLTALPRSSCCQWSPHCQCCSHVVALLPTADTVCPGHVADTAALDSTASSAGGCPGLESQAAAASPGHYQRARSVMIPQRVARPSEVQELHEEEGVRANAPPETRGTTLKETGPGARPTNCVNSDTSKTQHYACASVAVKLVDPRPPNLQTGSQQ
eukprot:1748757-Amphidinium_carterae.2